jgi:hypothetical protein
MNVGETQRIVLTGGIPPYGHSFDQGWQVIDLKPETSNGFLVTALRKSGAPEAPACRSSFSSTIADALADGSNSRWWKLGSRLHPHPARLLRQQENQKPSPRFRQQPAKRERQHALFG